MKRMRFVLLLAACGALGLMVAVFRPAAEEVDESEPSTVSESDLQVYIKVYTAMQDDHDLTIDNAITPHHISLDDFRQLERRIQNQPRLVDRVREALLEDRKAHSAFAESAATPTPVRTPEAKPRQHKKK
ncbi:MAG: hypothetical protein ACHQ9S_09420 [Candidatus Binatia bacterium]